MATGNNQARGGLSVASLKHKEFGMCWHDDEPYKPNKYTRYISMADWRKIVYGEGPQVVSVIDPGYTNEPHQEPTKSE